MPSGQLLKTQGIYPKKLFDRGGNSTSVLRYLAESCEIFLKARTKLLYVVCCSWNDGRTSPEIAQNSTLRDASSDTQAEFLNSIPASSEI